MNENEIETVEHGELDQTKFSEESVFLPASSAKVASTSTAKSRPTPLKLLLIAVPVMLGLLVLTLIFTRQADNRQTILPSPSAIPEAGTLTEIERRFATLAAEIQAADPTSFTLAFPPIDFTLTLPDATELRRRQR